MITSYAAFLKRWAIQAPSDPDAGLVIDGARAGTDAGCGAMTGCAVLRTIGTTLDAGWPAFTDASSAAIARIRPAQPSCSSMTSDQRRDRRHTCRRDRRPCPTRCRAM